MIWKLPRQRLRDEMDQQNEPESKQCHSKIWRVTLTATVALRGVHCT